MAHAYVVEGDRHQALATVRAHASQSLGLSGDHHPDFIVVEYGLFSVDDAREVARFASSSPVAGDSKMLVIATTRIFHEAQNALLKLFEEPPKGVTMVLIVPSFGQLLPTLRSRVAVLSSKEHETSAASGFLALDESARGAYIAKLLERTKADKDEDTQEARGELLRLMEGLMIAGYSARERASGPAHADLTQFLSDLDTFLPILHERSAPLKLIFEHLLLVLPRSLTV